MIVNSGLPATGTEIIGKLLEQLLQVFAANTDTICQHQRTELFDRQVEQLDGDAPIQSARRCPIAVVGHRVAQSGVEPASSKNSSHESRHGRRQGQRGTIGDNRRFIVIDGLAIDGYVRD